MKLGLVSCTKSKKSYPCKAYEMYSPSNLFKKAYQYAKTHYNKVIILSAKYGLLLPDDEIEPYNLTLKTMRKKQRQEWADIVFEQMIKRLDLTKIRSAYFHAGRKYRQFLIPKLEATSIRCVIPLNGLSLGQQIAWYNKYLNK